MSTMIGARLHPISLASVSSNPVLCDFLYLPLPATPTPTFSYSLSLSLSPAMFAAALRPATLRAFPRALAQPRLVPAFAAISTRSISRSSPFPLFGLARLGR